MTAMRCLQAGQTKPLFFGDEPLIIGMSRSKNRGDGQNRLRSRNASGIFSCTSGDSDLYSVAHVWPQLAQVTIMTVLLATRSVLPTC